ncbi:MAG: sigma-54 interaction domain-containing protein [bacterium]
MKTDHANQELLVQDHLLFVGDKETEKRLVSLLPESVRKHSHSTTDPAEARNIVTGESPCVIIIDLDETRFHPLRFVEELTDIANGCNIIGITERNPLRLVVNALKAGVRQVINTNDEPSLLQEEIDKSLERVIVQKKGEALHRKHKERFDFSEIIGHDSSMTEIIEVLTRIIRRKWVTVLIRGETGTGKELIARAIHYNSFSEYRPFVEIHCSALPESLLESELFGHEKGAFTDARTSKKGLFEVAENGTLFLDEIGDVTPNIQVKLLKALEEKRFRRVGGTKDIHVQTRIVAATNRDLQSAIREDQFRTDLYYRLNVISVFLPALRERGDDVLLLAHHFLNHYAQEYDSQMRGFTKDAIGLMKSYPWPGNVRELQHTIERIVLLGKGSQMTKEDLLDAIESESTIPMTQRDQSTSVQIVIPPEGMSLEEGEKRLIAAVLEKTGWNKRQTAKTLKISRPRLDRKIERYELAQ